MFSLIRFAVVMCLLVSAGCAPSKPAPAVTKPASFAPGSIVKFDVKSYVGNTPADIDEMEKFSIAQDTTGMTNMLISPRVFIAGGQLRVIETVGRHTRVRAIDGDYADRAGWTLTEWLKKAE